MKQNFYFTNKCALQSCTYLSKFLYKGLILHTQPTVKFHLLTDTKHRTLPSVMQNLKKKKKNTFPRSSKNVYHGSNLTVLNAAVISSIMKVILLVSNITGYSPIMVRW